MDNICQGIELTCAEFEQHLSEKQGHEVSLCREHMSESEVDDLVFESMLEKFNEMVNRMMLDKATLQVRKEWELAFDQSNGYSYNTNGYVSLDSDGLPKVYTDVAERTRNKAFRKYILKYYEAARCEKNASGHENILPFLIEKLEAIGIHVEKEVSEMFKTDLTNTLEKKFSTFKDEEVCYDIHLENIERKEWAIKKLKQIREVEKDSLDDGIQTLIKDAKVEIKKIYKRYEKQIRDAYGDHDIPFEQYPFRFSTVVQLYPIFKPPGSDRQLKSWGWNWDRLPPLLTDNYEEWYKKIWNEIEIRKEKCACDNCTKNERYSCKRVYRQRKLGLYFRTCPLCQKNIDFESFEKGWHYDRDHENKMKQTFISWPNGYCVGGHA